MNTLFHIDAQRIPFIHKRPVLHIVDDFLVLAAQAVGETIEFSMTWGE